MKNCNRVFLIVLDSLGIGALPDAYKYGDENSNTLHSISKSDKFFIPNLLKLGLGNIDGVDYLPKTDKPLARYARLSELSSGKDTTIGHFEMAGVVMKEPFRTYPNGFPTDLIEELESKMNAKTIVNKPYSGTKVIEDYGTKSIEEGSLIIYTSADSVLQLAGHEKYFGLDRLYECCRIARQVMTGANAVGRIIARPFIGEEGNYTRTTNRHDYAIKPPTDTMLNILQNQGKATISVGKIYDIFAGSGLSESNPTKSNEHGMEITYSMLDRDFNGLCFINLVDFDMLYGHRNNIDGYANCLSAFDKWLGSFMDKLSQDDCLMITADHGCDPATTSTDHSREYVPLIVYGQMIEPKNMKTRDSFRDVAVTVLELLNIGNNRLKGSSVV